LTYIANSNAVVNAPTYPGLLVSTVSPDSVWYGKPIRVMQNDRYTPNHTYCFAISYAMEGAIEFENTKENYIMMWVKRNSCSTVREAVETGSGLTADELINPYPISPNDIVDMKEAVGIVNQAIKKGEIIHIVGDYDADGVTSTAILFLTLQYLGCEPTIRLPRRFSDGYGLSRKIAEELNEGVVMLVDNGITAFEGIDLLQRKDLTVIVMDHHLPDKKLPEADCIVDPYIDPDSNKPEFRQHYCGAGLALKFAELLVDDTVLLDQLTMLAAIGTVADVMPLIGDNRRIVKDGLELMRGKCNIGIAALLELLEISAPTEQDIGFKIGPLLNAPGRLFDNGAEKSLKLLLSQDMVEAAQIAQELIEINEKRKALVKEAYTRAMNIISDDCLYGSPIICVYDPATPEGIVGIIASKIAEACKTPAIVLTDSAIDPTIIKGSGRSYGTINLRETLKTVAFLSFGGHAGAIGLSFHKARLDSALNSINLAFELCETPTDSEGTCEYDLEINAEEVGAIEKELKKYAPYGSGNPMPVFLLRNVVLSPRYGSHFKIMGADMKTIKMFAKDFDILSFSNAQKFAEFGNPRRIDVVGTISENRYKFKKSLQVQAIDFERSVNPNATPTSSLSAALGAISI
jgi:single-stranded-DNA-specific exonuclease